MANKPFRTKREIENRKRRKLKSRDLIIRMIESMQFKGKPEQQISDWLNTNEVKTQPVTVPDHARKRKKAIQTEFEDLKALERRKMKEVLKVAAECLVQLEEIKWRAYSVGHTTGEIKFNPPSLIIKYDKLEAEQRTFFTKEVEKIRELSKVQAMAQSISGKRGMLSDEGSKIEKMLEGYDPEVEVENLIGKFRPKRPEPEETDTVHEGPRLSGHVPSYDQPVMVDYGYGYQEEPAGGQDAGFSAGVA